MNNKKKYIVLTIVSVIAFILITVGVTYSFFSYIGQGSTENTIESGSINFIYEEVNKMGNGISITDAMPISDSEGKASNNYFDFKVKSSTGTTIAIPYEITTRVVEGSDDLSDYVKLYLTKVNGTNEQQVALSVYSNLSDSTNTLASQYNDKTLYKGEIPAGVTDYTENYRLRMWLNDNPTDGSVLDYSPVYVCSDTTYTNQTDCESNNGVWNPTENYNNQNKTFSIKVNVYANGEQATQEKIESATTTDISGIRINNITATENTDPTLNYDYYVETSKENSNNIEIIPLNDGQTYTVENITEAEANAIKGISTQNINLVSGYNYLKVTVTSATRKESKIYIVKVYVDVDDKIHSLSINECPIIETFSRERTRYTCVTDSNSVTPIYTVDTGATVVVNGGSNLQAGNNVMTISVTDANNIRTTIYEINIGKITSTTFNATNVNDNIELSYTGNVQNVKIDKAGRYKLEVWGAQGAGSVGGLGGYSTGEVTLEKNSILSVVVGSTTTSNNGYKNGGYNGGGNGAGSNYLSGGGATHIAKADSIHTVLSSYETADNAINYVYIVAGGGGGTGYNQTGGAGGGLTGGDGNYSCTVVLATGGTQTEGGTAGRGVYNNGYDGSFGQGGDGALAANTTRASAGGGGGWYGGGSSGVSQACGASGAGGSGYLNTTLGLLNGNMSSGINSGNGHAKITYLGD